MDVPPAEKKKSKLGRWLMEWLVVVVGALLLAWVPIPPSFYDQMGRVENVKIVHAP